MAGTGAASVSISATLSDKLPVYSGMMVGIIRLTRLIVPENDSTGRSPDVSMPRMNSTELPARVTSARPSINSPSLRGVEKLAGKRHGDAGSLQDGGRGREQAVVRERHEAAAMDVVAAVEMLLRDPERAVDAAVVLHAVPEWSVIGLVGVAAPGAPARKFAFGADMQVGAVEECRFGEVVHVNRPSNSGLRR